MSPFRTAPVTTECLVICAAMFLVCQLYRIDGVRFREAQRHWGAVVQLPATVPAGAPEAIERELRGPFDLWSGEWWRIPASAFHHAHLLHLLLNCLLAWTLGRRLEKCWGSLRFLLFLLPAITIPLLLEVISGNAAVGFSGAICAMLGAQIALQHLGAAADEIPDVTLQISLGLILAGIPATAIGLVPIANVAHVSGVAYGWMTAWLCCRAWERPALVRAIVVAAHLLILPGLEFAMHPFTSGRYLWYRADHDPAVTPEQRTSLLEQALQRDPTLTGIWLRLIDQRIAEDDYPQAWTLAVKGLSFNPVDADLMEAARRVWRRLAHGSARDTAVAELKQEFGERFQAWMAQIRGISPAAQKQHANNRQAEPALDPRDFPLDKPMEMDWNLDKPAPAAPANPPDAIEGAAV